MCLKFFQICAARRLSLRYREYIESDVEFIEQREVVLKQAHDSPYLPALYVSKCTVLDVLAHM